LDGSYASHKLLARRFLKPKFIIREIRVIRGQANSLPQWHSLSVKEKAHAPATRDSEQPRDPRSKELRLSFLSIHGWAIFDHLWDLGRVSANPPGLFGISNLFSPSQYEKM